MTHINQRRDTSTNWTVTNPVLELGEVGWETNTLKAKIGNGVAAWADLDYAVDFSPYALITQSITNGDITHSPSGDAVFDALAAMIVQVITDTDTTHVPSADAVHDALTALVVQTIANGDTTHAPSADAIFDQVVMNILADAKGDIIVATAADTWAKKTVGSNGARLVADSAQSTGLRWTTALYFEGAGSPEGSVTAPVGSQYSDTTNGVLYLKITGAGNTGWMVSSGVSTFTGVTYNTGWSDYGSGYEEPSFDLVNGRVHMRGAAKHGTPSTLGTVLTLPVGYRPAKIREFHVPSNTGSVSLLVNPDGTVALSSWIVGTDGAGFIAFDPVNFDVAV